MLKFKKMLSMALVVGMITSMSTNAFAAQATVEEVESNIEVIALSADISEETLDEITNSVEAGLVYDDGTTVPIDAVVTVEKMPSTSRSAANSYSVTLSSKIVSDSADQNSSKTNASATLQLVWTDGPGLQNSIDEVSGTLDIVKGKLTSGHVRYGDGWRSAILWTDKNVGSASSFTYRPNMVVADPTADYSIGFEGEVFTMYLYVSANVFQ